MATYSPESLGIKAPAGGFQQGGWYGGRQYWGGTLSDPGVIHPSSNQQGAGKEVSKEVNAQSAAKQGKSAEELERYLEEQRRKQQQAKVQSTSSGVSTASGSGKGITGGGGSTAGKSSLNLEAERQKLFDELGIAQMQEEAAAKTAEIEARRAELEERKAEINENPWLAEASRTGRIRKLEELAQGEINNLINELNTIEGRRSEAEQSINQRLGIQVQQVGLDRQARADALQEMNLLLTSGAIAEGDIDTITRYAQSTGMSEQMISGLIKAANTPEVKPQVIQSQDNYGNVTVSVIDANTGAVINQQSLGAIGQSKSSGGGSVTPGSSEYNAINRQAITQFLSGNTNDYGHVSPTAWNQAMMAWIGDGLGSRDDFINNFGGMTDPYRNDFEQNTGYGFPKYMRDELTSGEGGF